MESNAGDMLSVSVELFKRGIFDPITTVGEKKHEKQEQALRILTDNTTVEFLYGGAAGGAKSWTGCAWLTMASLAYPGTHWFVGRESLKRLRESTHLSFFKVFKALGVRLDVDVKYNGQDHYWQFSNGSRIDYLDLRYLPSDSLYERYGSVEYTGGWIEEGGEINFGAYDTLKTRIGRHLNDQYGIIRKLFVTCNPKKNWMYQVFYKPWKNGSLSPTLKYLPAFVQDNPFIETGYIDALMSTNDKVKKERLLKGNWDYDDSPNAMCDFDAINAIFDNDLALDDGFNYLTADIARFGSDRARIGVWRGWKLIEVISYDVSATTTIQTAINHLRRKYDIPKRQAIADEDGVGGGVVDNCKILGFKNNGKPFKEENYKNLQTQCAYKLAERINKGDFGIECDISMDDREMITTELQMGLQTHDADSDNKLQIIPKEEVKGDIGHSPDWRDLFLMRAYFDYKKPTKQDVAGLFGY